MMPLINLENLSKIYQSGKSSVEAISNISLQFDEGEFTAIVGPSGSGKTTLLNLIGALDKPNQGKIYIRQRDITLMKERQLTRFRLENIGFIFQHNNLVPVLTALENIELLPLLRGISKKTRRTIAIRLLEEIGLKDKMNCRPKELSGGQQQKIAIARALANEPSFILADEATANLDSKSAEDLLELMYRLNREKNTTFVFSTHDPLVIQKANRVITLKDGRIADDSTKFLHFS